MIAVGIRLSDRFNHLDFYSKFAFVILAFGLVTLMIGFFGIYGAISERGMLLRTYIISLVFMALLQLVLGIVALVKKDDVPFYM